MEDFDFVTEGVERTELDVNRIQAEVMNAHEEVKGLVQIGHLMGGKLNGAEHAIQSPFPMRQHEGRERRGKR
jgi:hypothetical protein